MNQFFTLWDFILLVGYLIIILVFSHLISNNSKNPLVKKYFTKGLFIKIFASIFISLVYVYYYNGGSDMFTYFEYGKSLANMFFYEPSTFFKVLFGDLSPETLSHFNNNTGYFALARDINTTAIRRFAGPFVLLGAKSFIITGVVLSTVLYPLIFRLFKFISTRYNEIDTKYFFIAILAVPSTLIWSGTILKDSFTFAAICISIPAYFNIIENKKRFANTIWLIIGVYLLIALKPYILYAALVGVLFSLLISVISKVKNNLLKYIVFPIILISIYFAGLKIVETLNESLGGIYSSTETMIGKAKTVQEDLIRSQYGSNSFNIGSFDVSIMSIIKKSPKAIIAGLFRPFLWDARTIFILMSALENLALLYFSLLLLIKLGVRKAFGLIRDPYMSFAIIFTLTMGFMVGLSTSNFGALVRYKIPLLPYFVSFLVIGLHKVFPNKMSSKVADIE